MGRKLAKLNIDENRIVWKRVMDMNDRALRFIDINTSGVAKDFKRVDGFDITVASEVMAIFCLSNDLNDLEKKLGKIVLSSNQTLIWDTLNQINYKNKIEGYGELFNN